METRKEPYELGEDNSCAVLSYIMNNQQTQLSDYAENT